MRLKRLRNVSVRRIGRRGMPKPIQPKRYIKPKNPMKAKQSVRVVQFQKPIKPKG